MVNLVIDGLAVSVPEGTTVMKAAARIGIEIPHLCFLEGINEISACKVCVVEMQGKEKLITACKLCAQTQLLPFILYCVKFYLLICFQCLDPHVCL